MECGCEERPGGRGRAVSGEMSGDCPRTSHFAVIPASNKQSKSLQERALQEQARAALPLTNYFEQWRLDVTLHVQSFCLY